MITACIMGKDEEDVLPRCLESLRGRVETVVYVDTGSSDRSVEIARSHGAEIHFFPWVDDFAAARNETLRHVQTPWALVIDCDECLVGEDSGDSGDVSPLASQLSGLACRLQVRDLDRGRVFSSYNQLRLLRRGHFHYEGAIHNRLCVTGGGAIPEPAHILGWHLEHVGYDTRRYQAKNKSERAMRGIAKEMEKRPGDPLLLYYRGRERMLLEDWDGALHDLFLALPGLKADPLQAKNELGAYRLILESMNSARVHQTQIKETLLEAVAAFPNSPDIWYAGGCGFANRRCWSAAEECYGKCLEAVRLWTWKVASDIVHQEWLIHFNRFQVWAAAEWVGAEKHLEACLQAAPTDVRATIQGTLRESGVEVEGQLSDCDQDGVRGS